MKKYIKTFLFAFVILMPTIALAQSIQIQNPIKAKTFLEIIDNVINFLMVASVPALIIFIIWGAFNILTAGGNPNKVKTGRDIILYAVIGFAVILISKGVAALVISILGANS